MQDKARWELGCGVGAGARLGWGLSCAVYMHVSENLSASLACVQASMLKIISASLAHLLHASVIKHIPMGPSWDTPHPKPSVLAPL